MPAREPRCHCGVLWSESPAAHSGRDAPSSPAGVGRFLLALGLVAAAGYGLYAAARQRERSLEAAEAAQQERIRLEAAAADGPSARPPETAPRAFAPSPYTIGAGGSSAFPFPSPRAELSPAAIRPRPGPADDASPSPTSMEEAWARARELLESPLGRISAETAELQQRYAPFAQTCLASPDGNWLVAMKSGAFVRGGVPYSKFGVTIDCDFARRELVARASVLKAELEAAERMAHAHSVLPGHWRKLLETYQLDIWDAY